MKKVLGKGLSALIPDTYIKQQVQAAQPAAAADRRTDRAAVPAAESGFQMIPLDQILPHEGQPRKDFSPQGIDELAASIKEKGILQPVIVKRLAEGRYSLICGERRWRAARLCGLTEIPVVIKDIADEDFLEWALIENIQREDLNPIEEAQAYWRLGEESGLSQDEIAKRVGKDRSTVANMIRLLRLPEEVRALLVTGRLNSGHARALLALLTPEHQRQLARRIAEENLSVRQVEAIVGRSNAHKRRAKPARSLTPEIADLENRLLQHLGTQVKMVCRKNQREGRIEIRFFSLDDLDRILQTIGLSRG